MNYLTSVDIILRQNVQLAFRLSFKVKIRMKKSSSKENARNLRIKKKKKKNRWTLKLNVQAGNGKILKRTLSYQQKIKIFLSICIALILNGVLLKLLSHICRYLQSSGNKLNSSKVNNNLRNKNKILVFVFLHIEI